MNNYEGMLVEELDALLEERGLKTSGYKSSKIARLEKYDEGMPRAVRMTEVKTYKPYEILFWAGVKKVYACTKCDWQEDKKDDAIMHYLSHFEREERDTILDILVKEI
jgi:hypothetical protein